MFEGVQEEGEGLFVVCIVFDFEVLFVVQESIEVMFDVFLIVQIVVMYLYEGVMSEGVVVIFVKRVFGCGVYVVEDELGSSFGGDLLQVCVVLCWDG